MPARGPDLCPRAELDGRMRISLSWSAPTLAHRFSVRASALRAFLDTLSPSLYSTVLQYTCLDELGGVSLQCVRACTCMLNQLVMRRFTVASTVTSMAPVGINGPTSAPAGPLQSPPSRSRANWVQCHPGEMGNWVQRSPLRRRCTRSVMEKDRQNGCSTHDTAIRVESLDRRFAQHQYGPCLPLISMLF